MNTPALRGHFIRGAVMHWVPAEAEHDPRMRTVAARGLLRVGSRRAVALNQGVFCPSASEGPAAGISLLSQAQPRRVSLKYVARS